jgi:hypothetical protein
VSFVAITLCVSYQRVFIVVSVCFVMAQSGNFWIYPRIYVLSSMPSVLIGANGR